MPLILATNTPSKKTQLLVQINLNLNNTKQQTQQQSYAISLNDIHLRLGKTLPTPQEPITTEVEDPPIKHIDESNKHTSHVAKEPSFPHRLREQGQTKENHVVIDLLNQLKQMTIKIPLLGAIKEVPTYTKSIKEACSAQLGRKRKDPITNHVLGKLSDLMLEKLVVPKYFDPRSPIVKVNILGIQVQNSLVDP